MNDVGLIPWLPLTQYAGPPEILLRQCRERIDRQARPEERVNLLAVTQVMATLQYNSPQLMTILGGSQVMIESPLIQELIDKNTAQTMRKAIVSVLEERFGRMPEDVVASLSSVLGENQLDRLHKQSVRCSDLDAFRAVLDSAIKAKAQRQPGRRGRSRR